MQLPLELLLLAAAALAAPLAPRSASFGQLAGLTANARDLSTSDARAPAKYFHESIYHPHYDGRFASAVLPRKTRLFHMRLLLRSYMLAMQRARVRTWVMHGSLLGWWWNRAMFPWDSDLDFCVDEGGMGELGAWWNMTVHEFRAGDLGMDVGDARAGLQAGLWDTARTGGARMTEPQGLKQGTWDQVLDEGKKYLLEVNPHYRDSSTSDKHNKIDARWIDTSTGLFIDITTVHPVPSSATNAQRTAHKFLATQPAQPAQHEPEEMYTKDTHLYTTASLFPLRESTLEDTPVLVPYAYEQLLLEEYGPQALTERWFNGYKFNAETKEWDVASEPPPPPRSKDRGSVPVAAGRAAKAGKKPKWRPAKGRESVPGDNEGDEVYVLRPGSINDVHVVPGGAA